MEHIVCRRRNQTECGWNKWELCIEQFLNDQVFTEICKYTHMHWILKWFLSISKRATFVLTAGRFSVVAGFYWEPWLTRGWLLLSKGWHLHVSASFQTICGRLTVVVLLASPTVIGGWSHNNHKRAKLFPQITEFGLSYWIVPSTVQLILVSFPKTVSLVLMEAIWLWFT